MDAVPGPLVNFPGRKQMQQFKDRQWRRLPGEQQGGKLRDEMTGMPSGSAVR